VCGKTPNASAFIIGNGFKDLNRSMHIAKVESGSCACERNLKAYIYSAQPSGDMSEWHSEWLDFVLDADAGANTVCTSGLYATFAVIGVDGQCYTPNESGIIDNIGIYTFCDAGGRQLYIVQ
jgi:hypothetical protein